ncbi:GNAT family N-acetyltransferase [Nocardia alba]|uniref:RimJ/RimL family protein N-acetyltransferase n=1 Tax=Nocardia alba TaxID=225051 RepID=A0A4V2PBI1_9NOCA|nr:GNAT family protein [Nocardia alba]TCJ97545.1 RimJ/RimL family protein N-acetyltransferase [Nocardia alba]
MSTIDDLHRFEPVSDPRPVDSPWPPLVWPIPDEVVLTGDVVRLTTADPEADAAELFRALDHEQAWTHIPLRTEDADRLADQLARWRADPEWHPWTVRLVRDVRGIPAGSIIGMTSYLNVSVRDARLEIGATVYSPAVWGSAVNPAAKHLLLGYAFDTLRTGRVQIKTDVRNHRSQQAIARLGAHYEGTLRREFRRTDGTVRDTALFSITAEDWPDVNERLTARLRTHDAKL